MRELLVGQREQNDADGREFTCVYYILIRNVPPPVACESYGVRIVIPQSGEAEEVTDITVLPERIQALTQLLLQGGVTPCTLRDVVEDWL